VDVPVTTAGNRHALGCNENHFHASPACCAEQCDACAVDRVVTPFPTTRPNQLLLELLKQVDAIEALVIVARDQNGRLYVSWTDQDDGTLAESSHLLAGTVDAHLYTSHAVSDEEDDKPTIKLSFLANGNLEPAK